MSTMELPGLTSSARKETRFGKAARSFTAIIMTIRSILRDLLSILDISGIRNRDALLLVLGGIVLIFLGSFAAVLIISGSFIGALISSFIFFVIGRKLIAFQSKNEAGRTRTPVLMETPGDK